MSTADHIRQVMAELDRTLGAVATDDVERLVDMILSARRVFVAGAGRSGLAMKAFAMRLMHLGLRAYVVGETVTPAMTADDLLLIGSGSGETASLVAMAEKVRALKARLALVTIVADSRIGRLAEAVVAIPAPSPKARAQHGVTSVQPMGSLFEQSLLILLDVVVLRLMEQQKTDSAAMFERHANLE